MNKSSKPLHILFYESAHYWIKVALHQFQLFLHCVGNLKQKTLSPLRKVKKIKNATKSPRYKDTKLHQNIEHLLFTFWSNLVYLWLGGKKSLFGVDSNLNTRKDFDFYNLFSTFNPKW